MVSFRGLRIMVKKLSTSILPFILITLLLLLSANVHASMELEVLTDGTGIIYHVVNVTRDTQSYLVRLIAWPDELIAYGPEGFYIAQVVVNESGIYAEVLYPSVGPLYLTYLASNLSTCVDGTWILNFTVDDEVVVKLPERMMPLTIPDEALSVDCVDDTYTITLPPGSYVIEYGMMPLTPKIKVTGLTVTPSIVTVGREVLIKVEVVNEGDLEGSKLIEVKVNNEVKHSEEVSLLPGESKTLTYRLSMDKAGVYVIEVDGLTSTLKVEEVKRPCILVTAAYGSELSPKVELLRSIRDLHVAKTKVGYAYLCFFNTWYYSWSPQAARLAASNEHLRLIARLFVTPFVESVGFAWSIYEHVPLSPEVKVSTLILTVSLLVGLIYLTPLTLTTALLSTKLRRLYLWLWKPITVILTWSYTVVALSAAYMPLIAITLLSTLTSLTALLLASLIPTLIVSKLRGDG